MTVNPTRQTNGQPVLVSGISIWGYSKGDLGDESPPVGSRAKTLVGNLGDEVIPQKLKQFVDIVHRF